MKREHSFGIIPFSKQNGEWKVFLILHQKGHWGFPKGRPSEGEKNERTAIREFQEETGLLIERFLSASPFSEHYRFEREGERVDKTVSYYPAIITGTQTLQVEEVKEGKWLTFSEAHQTITFPESQNLFQRALDELHDILQ